MKDSKLELLHKVEIHLLSHLVDNMLDFESSSAFNSERSDKAKATRYSCLMLWCLAMNSLLNYVNARHCGVSMSKLHAFWPLKWE